MNIVRKYGLSTKKECQIILLPKDSRILSVIVQQENIYIFVEEDCNANQFSYSDCKHFRTVEFAIFKDCRHFPVDNYQFLGTIVFEFGNQIYHVFYRNV